jgi:transcriptional regulator with XRE-family HTH domain
MRTSLKLDQLREQAVMLRRQGKSRRQIKEILGPMSNSTLNEALKDEPAPEWTRRPNAKDDLRIEARRLRALGQDYEEIAAALGVAKSTVSLWMRDLPVPARLSQAECRKRSAEGASRYWAAERPARQARRAAVREAAAVQIGELSDRELLIAGAIAYWCEGSKSKPYRRSDRVVFTNSDPNLIRLFLRFLDATGTARTSLSFRICIHQSADAEVAQRFWLEITEATAGQFRRPTLKRHRPQTTRKMWARTTTAASASTSIAAQTSTTRLRAGPPPAWRYVAARTEQDRGTVYPGCLPIPCQDSGRYRGSAHGDVSLQTEIAIRRRVIGSPAAFEAVTSWFESRRRNLSPGSSPGSGTRAI